MDVTARKKLNVLRKRLATTPHPFPALKN